MGAATGKKPLAEVPIQEANFPCNPWGVVVLATRLAHLGSCSDEPPCGGLFNGNNNPTAPGKTLAQLKIFSKLLFLWLQCLGCRVGLSVTSWTDVAEECQTPHDLLFLVPWWWKGGRLLCVPFLNLSLSWGRADKLLVITSPQAGSVCQSGEEELPGWRAPG